MNLHLHPPATHPNLQNPSWSRRNLPVVSVPNVRNRGTKLTKMSRGNTVVGDAGNCTGKRRIWRLIWGRMKVANLSFAKKKGVKNGLPAQTNWPAILERIREKSGFSVHSAPKPFPAVTIWVNTAKLIYAVKKMSWKNRENHARLNWRKKRKIVTPLIFPPRDFITAGKFLNWRKKRKICPMPTISRLRYISAAGKFLRVMKFTARSNSIILSITRS